jgi:hypothetical protein
MPVNIVAFDDSPSCRGWTWVIRDRDALAQIVAHLLMGQYLHAQRLISGRASPTVSALEGAYLRLVKQLTNPTVVAHRDGWLFQMISWVAAHVSDPNLIARAPQPRQADKGFDGIFVRQRSDRSGALYVLVCEDKATEQPRTVVRSEVWPALKELESGARDNEILSELTAVLSTVLPRTDAEDAVRRIVWKHARRYRVSITVPTTRTEEDQRKRLFKGYRSVVRGKCVRRRGEMLILDDLRPWMNGFALLVARKLQQMPK